MNRIGIVLLALLALTVVSAQTRWEYARLSIETYGFGFNTKQPPTLSFEDNDRFVGGSWESFTKELGIQEASAMNLTIPVLNYLGLEGYEMVNYSANKSEDGIISETWFFKRPLPSP